MVKWRAWGDCISSQDSVAFSGAVKQAHSCCLCSGIPVVDSLLLVYWYGEWVLPLQYYTSSLVALTFIANAEADVRVALVGGEEEIQKVGGADEKLGNLGSLVTSNQR